MDERFKLPEEISEIHLGFSSLKYFVGHTDIGKCTETVRVILLFQKL